MTAKSVSKIFENYQKARMCFVQSIADWSQKEQFVDTLDKSGALELLQPLLTDPVDQIQQCACIALGRLATHSPDIAARLLDGKILSVLLNNGQETRSKKTSTLFVIRALSKHNSKLAEKVVDQGGLQYICMSMEDFENIVKESAAWALGYIARHTEALAKSCIDSGVLPLLILSLQEPEIAVKQIACSAVSDIAKHSPETAHAVADAGAVPYLAKNLQNINEILKVRVLCALSSCTKHSAELAECVIEAEVFPSVLIHMSHACQNVRKNAACLVRDVVKHNLELTQLVVNNGGIGALVETIIHSSTDVQIPAITSLGYIGGHSGQLAYSVLGCKVAPILSNILKTSSDECLLSVTTWTVGQIGKHSPEHSYAIACNDVFTRLNQLYTDEKTSEDLKCKAKISLKQCLQKCMNLSYLAPLLYDAPTNILKYVLGQYSKVLPEDPRARRLFVTSGGLKRVQEIEAKPGTQLMEYKTIINASFPEEVVRFYSPGYSDALLEQVEQYSPQLMTVFRETNKSEEKLQTDIDMLMNEADSECGQEILNIVDCHD